MKNLILAILATFAFSASAAGDYSELGGSLDERVERGCAKYAAKKAEEHLSNHFNANFWAGGNVGAGSVNAAREALPNHISFLKSQCYNMVAEVLELKLGYGPWQ